MAYDGSEYLYQICTFFPGGGSLSAVHAVKFSKSNLSKEIDRIDIEGPNGLLNLRGIEYDPEDKNLWVSAYDGAIYKIAGFETKTISSVDEGVMGLNAVINADIYPNPASDYFTVEGKCAGTDNLLKIELFDLQGRLVLEETFVPEAERFRKQFRLNELPAGVYWLKMSDKRGILIDAQTLGITR
jgi:hypothetical protein